MGRDARPVHKRTLEEIANASASSDENYEDTAPRSSRKSRTKKSSGHKSRKIKQQRKKRSYDSDDVVDDSESLNSEEEFTDEEDEQQDVARNPRTGRPMRGGGRATIAQYAESDSDADVKFDDSDDEDDDIEQDDGNDDVADQAHEDDIEEDGYTKSKKSLIVKLHLAPDQLKQVNALPSTEAAATQRPSRRPSSSHSNAPRAVSEGRATRRSTRNSAEPEPLMELTNSGHVRIVGGKAPLGAGKMPAKTAGKRPSIIMEESQEDSQARTNEDGEPEPPLDSIEEGNVEDAEPSDNEDQEHMKDVDVADAADNSDTDGPVRRTRNLRKRNEDDNHRSQSRSQKNKKSASEDDYDPEDEDNSDEEIQRPKSSNANKRKRSSEESDDEPNSEASDEIDNDEIRAELSELGRPKRSKKARYTQVHSDTDIHFDQPARARRARQSNINYNMLPPEVLRADEQSEDDQPTQRPAAKSAGRAGHRSLFDMQGPFGGTTLRYGPDARALPLPMDDSSDDDTPQKPAALSGLPGMVPLTPHSVQPQNIGRTAAKKDVADITPLEISPDIGFDKVGGLDNHINQLKEMVLLPLLYPELYSKWKIPPPRGVLFHGPPGTGKTLLARALASSVSTGNKKVSFFMRKGADVMSKWVGEAERQLRLLFETAKNSQPAIIFFDEFDGLAPVRSSKQEQIHASIVTTLLALMDGMDNRGQIVVIGATNRPDSIDPAFRRPGRFDREFLFTLPNLEARRSIIDIHSRGWEPELSSSLKDDLAERTKGYGGSDLQALCSEAVINAVQRTYPQIYKSDKKLQVDTSSITVIAKDFLLAMRKLTPSSLRQTGAIAEPLPKKIAPLLDSVLQDVSQRLDRVIPTKRKVLTALEEAEYYDPMDPAGFEHEEILRAFERGRVFRPRLLIKGPRGMGQKYLASAILDKLDGFYVRTLDISTLFGDPASPAEAILSSAFKEARSRQPSILFIPQIDTWYATVSHQVLQQFSSLLKSLSADDAVLLLGVMEAGSAAEEPEPAMMRDLFGFSSKHEYQLRAPTESSRFAFFEPLMSYVRKRPNDFPEQENRKKRKLPELPLAPEEPKIKAAPSKEELKAQYKADRSTINMLRMALTVVMREIRDKWKALQKSMIPDRDIEYLLREQDPTYLTSDLTHTQRYEQQALRPYEVSTDKHGNRGLKHTASGQFFYNCNTLIVEQRLSNGYYKRPKEFLYDLKTIVKDHKNDAPEKLIKANDMYGYAMAECELIEGANPQLIAQCEAVFVREQERQKLAQDQAANNAARPAPTSTDATGPIQLGEPVHIRPDLPPPITPERPQHNVNGGVDGHANGGVHHTQSTQDHPDAMELDESSGSRPQFPAGMTVTPSNPTTTQHESPQSGPIKKMMPGSQIGDLHNSASTTTSGQKTSQRTSGASDRRMDASQWTNGHSTQPESIGLDGAFNSWLPAIESGSQFPDTQSTDSRIRLNTNQSTPHEAHSSAHGSSDPSQPNTFKQPALPAHVHANTIGPGGLPTAPVSSQPGTVGVSQETAKAINGHSIVHSAPITDLLNPAPASPPPPPPPPFILNEVELQDLHIALAKETEGLTVEQLEMIDARCMNVMWAARGTWNRTPVLRDLRDALDEVLDDVKWQAQLWQPSSEEI